MSRSSEIRSQRWKAAKAREQQMLMLQQEQEEAEEEDYERYPGDGGTGAGILSQPQNPENVLELNNPNEFFNMVPLLVSAIKSTAFYRQRCSKIHDFHEYVDEIYLKVTHLDPFEAESSVVTTRQASCAFCLLYRGMQMRLTKKQMQALLHHQDSPFIRAIGALYLRYLAPPSALWEWMEHLFYDQEEFTPEKDTAKYMTVATWMRSLLNVRYRDTILPRIPVPIEKQIQKQLSGSEASSLQQSEKKTEDPDFRGSIPLKGKTDQLVKCQICRAMYWEDKKWYDVRVEEPSTDKEGFWWLTFLPEEEYGNQEEVSWEHIRVFEDAPPETTTLTSSNKRARMGEEISDDDNNVTKVKAEQTIVPSAAPNPTPAELPRYDEL